MRMDTSWAWVECTAPHTPVSMTAVSTLISSFGISCSLCIHLHGVCILFSYLSYRFSASGNQRWSAGAAVKAAQRPQGLALTDGTAPLRLPKLVGKRAAYQQ